MIDIVPRIHIPLDTDQKHPQNPASRLCTIDCGIVDCKFYRLRLVNSSVRLFVYVFGFVRVCFNGRGYLGDEVFVEEIAVL